MQELGVKKAHVAGVSLGAVIGIWLSVKYPDKVKSLSVHSGWSKTDLFLKTVVEGWQVMAKALGSVAETVIMGIFPWCFTPSLYASKPEYINTLAEFVRGRPAQPIDAFLRQTEAVISHDCVAQLNKIKAPTLITFGEYDMITSTRFADTMKNNIRNSELLIFKGCSHAALYENTEEFNQKTLDYLARHSG